MVGRRGRSRLGLILLTSILLFPSVVASGGGADPNLELVISIDEPQNGGTWYGGTDSLNITISIRNNGASSVVIEHNPSCPVEISMVDETGAQFSNLREHRTCLSQRRASDVGAGQTLLLDTFSWNWQNGDGVTLASGTASILFDFESGTATTARMVHYQRAPEYLGELDLVAHTTPPLDGGEFTAGESVYSHLMLMNSGTETLTMNVGEGCRVVMSAATDQTTITPVLTELGCADGEVLGVGESVSLGWFSWDFTDGGESVALGEWVSHFSLTEVFGAETTASATLGLQHRSTHPSLTVSLDMGVLSDGVLVAGEELRLTTSLSNPDENSHHLRFNDSCLATVRMFSQTGLLMGDSRTVDVCGEAITEAKVDPLSQFALDERSWSMTDNDGCELDDGEYLIVVNVPELALQTSRLLTYAGDDTGAQCRASLQDTSLVSLNIISIEKRGEGTWDEAVEFQLRFENQVDIDLFWGQSCRLQFTLQRFGESVPYRVWYEACEDGFTGLVHIPADMGVYFTPYTIRFENLTPGIWHLTAETTGTPSLSTQWAHVWNPPVVIVEENDEEGNTAESGGDSATEAVVLNSWMAEGAWFYITTDEGGCWILKDAEGEEHAYTTTTILEWQPQPFTEGAYWVEENPMSTPACENWHSHLTVTEVLGEREVTVSAEDEVNADEVGAPLVTSPISTPAIVAVITSTGLLAALVAALSQVEWIRLPATKYGLLFLGMVKRKKENGGEYQRGRIVAYIELHRGIHFRALLSALEMSNGQLTHHLSVLESDDRIWRRKDGRKVRFYPASIDSSTTEDDLPVPVLTPDPDSLQGRILQMLDIYDNEYLNLSQKELSDKLETSQQLVSYHLKALEKWGLVEKERVAMRYRYNLTNRALILLDTADFPTLGDEK